MKMTLLLVWMLAEATAEAPSALVPPPQEIAPGVALLPGAMLPDRGPDGNTIVFDAPQGLVVVDTGRHAWHSDAILAYAKSRGRPIAAIVNTHWHLDHTSGNGRIRAAYPEAPVYATAAVDRVLAEGGFLARNLESAKPMLDDPKLSDVQKEEVGIFIATMAERDVLRPHVVVDQAGEFAPGRQGLQCPIDARRRDRRRHLALRRRERRGRARRSRDFSRAILRDRLPRRLAPLARRSSGGAIPYRDTRSRRADEPARSSTPGAAHSAPSWTASKARPRPASAPPAGPTGSLRSRPATSRRAGAALGYAEHYVGLLRANGGKSADCLAR